MPTPDALQRAIDEQRTRRVVLRRLPLPYGGDKAVAASIAQVHHPEPRTSTCVICLEQFPCRDAKDARLVLDS